MTSRPAEHLIHGTDGPVVIVTARVCAYLNKYAGLDSFRLENRGADSEVDNALIAIRIAELAWRKAATGTRQAMKPELDSSLEWMSTTEAAGLAGVTDRAIRKAIAGGHLKASTVAGRWRIAREDLKHYQANRNT